MNLKIRPLRAADLAQVMQIQAACYAPAFNEAPAVFAARLAAAPDTTWLAERGGKALAYLFAYPSRCGKLTRLGAAYAPLVDGDSLYLHDLAVHPEAAGQGLAGHLLAAAFTHAHAKGLAQVTLVSLPSAHRFWQRQGFAPVPLLNPESAAQLASYGPDARYLHRILPPAVTTTATRKISGTGG